MDVWDIPDSVSFGTLVRRGRKVKGLTRRQLSALCDGLDIVAVEKGEWMPRYTAVRLLIKVLGLEEDSASAVAMHDLIRHPDYPEEGRKILLDPALTPDEKSKKFREHLRERVDKLEKLVVELASNDLPLPDFNPVKETLDLLEQERRHRDS